MSPPAPGIDPQELLPAHTGRQSSLSPWPEPDFLKAPLIEAQSFRALAGDHPVMSIAWAERERELCVRLAEIPENSLNHV